VAGATAADPPLRVMLSLLLGSEFNLLVVQARAGRGVIVLRGLDTTGDQISVTRVADQAIRETKAISENFIGRLNTDDARNALEQQIVATFLRLQRDGALVPSVDGTDPAFLVDVYSIQQDFAQGIVRIDIAVRPVRVGGDAGPVLRPLGFGERRAAVRVACEAKDARGALAAVVTARARLVAGTLDPVAEEICARHLAGASVDGPSFDAATLRIASATGWSPAEIDATEARAVDGLARARESQSGRLMFSIPEMQGIGFAEGADVQIYVNSQLENAELEESVDGAFPLDIDGARAAALGTGGVQVRLLEELSPWNRDGYFRWAVPHLGAFGGALSMWSKVE